MVSLHITRSYLLLITTLGLLGFLVYTLGLLGILTPLLTPLFLLFSRL